nr:ribonuclease H-like domain-containing protein [Tanacetum cinerariifolium]
MMHKILSQLNQLKAKPEDNDINLKFLRALPSSWSQVALTLKTKGRLELFSFDDLYYKLNTLEVDVKGYTIFSSSQSAGPSHSIFVSTTSASKKMSYEDSPSYSSTTTYTASSNSKTGSHRSDRKIGSRRKIDFDKKESARFNKKKVRCYKCQQRGHFAKECREKGGNDKKRYSSFKIKEIGKKEEDSKALITVDTLVDWTDHDGKSDGVIASKEFGMIAGCDTEDAIEEGAAKIYNLITGADTEETSTAAVLLRTGKVNIPSARPQPVPTGKPKVFAPFPTGRQNRPFPVPTDRGYSLSTYTPYVPTMYYNHMKYGGDRWATAVKPSAGCSWKSHSKGRKVMFGGGEGRITGKGTIRTPTLDFENVYYVKELQQFNLFSISQICDKKNRVLFTDTECLVLSKVFKLPDESMVVLRVPRKHNLYTINLNNLCPGGNLACLVANASVDESVK